MQRYSKDHYIGKGALSASKKTIHGEYSTHRHEFYELEYILSGSGEYRIDGTVYPIRPGMLFFMTPFNLHSVSASDCRVYNVMFSEQICDTDFLVRLLSLERPTCVDTTTDHTAFWESTLEELVRATHDKSYVSYLLNSLLGKLCAYAPAHRAIGDPIKKGMLYILHHFRENLTLAQTAKHVGFAPTYFSALFKQEVGVTFKEYVDRLRFEYAKKLIEHSELSVIRICHESGFADYPNFIRRFKGHFGISPGRMIAARGEQEAFMAAEL